MWLAHMLAQFLSRIRMHGSTIYEILAPHAYYTYLCTAGYAGWVGIRNDDDGGGGGGDVVGR